METRTLRRIGTAAFVRVLSLLVAAPPLLVQAATATRECVP